MSALFIFLAVVILTVELCRSKSRPHPFLSMAAGAMLLITFEQAAFDLRNRQTEAVQIIDASKTARVTWARIIERQATAPYKSRGEAIEKALASRDSQTVLMGVMSALATQEPVGEVERALNTQISLATAIQVQESLRTGYKLTEQAYLDYVQQEMSATILVKLGVMPERLPNWDEASQGCQDRHWDCRFVAQEKGGTQ